MVGLKMKINSKNTLLTDNKIFNRINKCISNIRFITDEYNKLFNIIDTEEKKIIFYSMIISKILNKYKEFTDEELLIRGAICLFNKDGFDYCVKNKVNKNMLIESLIDTEIMSILTQMKNKLENQFNLIMSVF